MAVKSDKRIRRIIGEITELRDSSQVLSESGIYTYVDDSNVNNVYALLIGTSNTPYNKGYYFFKLTYPEEYPFKPPVAKYCTQGILTNDETKTSYHIRFNPNLYVCGKVCLSMLNTWTGPGWVPTNTISNVLVAIQALVLNENPLINEPGYESAPQKELKKYESMG